MHLTDIVHRQAVPSPWAEGEKIPWNDPDFSQRMLAEHLSQEHDAASRRSAKIDRQVAWIHSTLLAGKPGRVLDLGCGPGLYASRLARLGHTCTGIDFSPASVAYARQQAAKDHLPCTYLEADLRFADFGAADPGEAQYNLAMLIFGEFNTFRIEDARKILAKVYTALAPGGLLLLEPHTFAAVQEIGSAAPSWYSAERGLWSPKPHLVLNESFWDAGQRIATKRHFIIDAGTGQVTRHAASMQAYSDEDYRLLLESSGFAAVTFYPSLTGAVDESQAALLAITARKG